MEYPSFKLLLYWLLGILIAEKYHFSDALSVALVLLSLLAIFVFHSFSFKTIRLENFLTMCTVIALSIFGFQEHNNATNSALSKYTHQTVSIHARVLEVRKEDSLKQQLIVVVDALELDSIRTIKPSKCVVYLKGNKRLLPGDSFWAKASINKIAKAKHQYQFDQSKYWKRKGISEQVWMESSDLLLDENQDYSVIESIRRKQREGLVLLRGANISESAKQVLSALVYGDKRGMDVQLSKSFTDIGVVHVLAVSGLHVGLIYGLFAWLLGFISFLNRIPILRSALLIVIIILYALFTGMSPSVMRASLMFILFAMSSAFSRRTSPFNIVFLSAFILLLINPNLLFDISFQLSYLAVLGILYFYRFAKVFLLDKHWLLRFIMGLAIVSVSAQLSTGLLGLYYFHQFPPLFLVGNILVLPLITLLLYLGLAYQLLLVFQLNTNFVDRLVDAYCDFIFSLLNHLNRLSPEPIINAISLNEMLYVYGLIVLSALIFLERKYKLLKVLYAYILLAVMVVSFSDDEHNEELMINADFKGVVITALQGDEMVLIKTNVDFDPTYLLGDYALQKNVDCVDTVLLKDSYQNSFVRLDSGMIQVFDLSMVILHEKTQSTSCIDLDLLILDYPVKDVPKIEKLFHPQIVLLSASIYPKERLRLKRDWKEIGVELIDLKEEAYFYQKLKP